jgi:uncharacterized circularly permuted ATP-grasp superfamily protein
MFKRGEQPVLANRVINLRARTSRRAPYEPTKGYIGKYEVDVANYIFRQGSKDGYLHSQTLVDAIMGKSVQEHFSSSQRITKFLKKRDLTFQKSDKNGVYRIFTVPVTTAVVPLPKSVFNHVELAAQILMVSLRKVLQSIYGSETIRDSEFVKSLPDGIRKTFLDATEKSPHYIPQLHHANMKEYPFLDNVGLDLVLIEEYSQKRGTLTHLVQAGRVDEIPELPFRVLELNAGSPSGASNNVNILEGILREDPEILDSVGRVMPNDHFQVLRDTYRSLGESWTGRTDGVQVLLPPGGANGASPEIHQLAAYSGIVYCDPGQLYADSAGWIHLRTADGKDPVVTAIYSRVNSDSALFDRKKGVFLRDPESGAPIHCVDLLKPWDAEEPEFIKDEDGNLVPLESDYAIPNALDAILNRKLYMGGLNRLLDNKIILATLTDYAPEYFKEELLKLGLDLNSARVIPPECLPSKKESLDVIEKTPNDWVIKAPNLSGGTGVYILMTLDDKKRREVIKEARKNPESYAYQKVVKIGRIPVAVRQRGSSKFRFANLAADIRMWVFYGGNDTLPKLTHNALVRYAPKEKGPMSSIVNTSKGGGYAPFVVVDDLGLENSITGRELAQPLEPAPLQTSLPAFVGAQLVQVANIVHELKRLVRDEDAELFRVSGYLYSLKIQVREVASFIHPRCMETIYSMIELIEKRNNAKRIAEYFLRMNHFQARLVSTLKILDHVLPNEVYLVLDELNIVSQELVNRGYSKKMKNQDLFNFGHLSHELRKLTKENPEHRKHLNQLRTILKQMIDLKFPSQPMNMLVSQRIESLIEQFCDLASRRLANSVHATEFAGIFTGQDHQSQILYRETFVTENATSAPRSGTEWEMINKMSIADSQFVEPEIKKARSEWLVVLEAAKELRGKPQLAFLTKARKKHFEKYPSLKEIQALIDRPQNRDVYALISLMSVLPYAAYNIRQYAIEQNCAFHELFTDSLSPERICILDRPTRLKEKLSLDQFSGECFAKKRSSHGLISDSDRYMWIAEEQSPFIQLYTIGHELIHSAQIKEVMKSERDAVETGPLEFARFLNFYGNFLSLAANTLETHEADVAVKRKPLYGFADRVISNFFAPVIQDVREGLRRGGTIYQQKLMKYGSLFGYMMPVSNPVRVKALREVIPALENAKNILFAKECGLDIVLNEVKSALPTANKMQLKRCEEVVINAVKGWNLDFEALRVIASHQYYGVMFSRAQDEAENLTIDSDPGAIYLNTGYNQTQQ